MKLSDYIFKVAPRIPIYAATRWGWLRPVNPLTLTFSVTAACQSLCKTCRIGLEYRDNPAIARSDLDIEEVEKVFRSLGRVYFFNVSGGEPFMRRDLAEVVRLACIHLKPGLIHIPTNALAPKQIEETTRKILGYMDQNLPSCVPISVKPSIDGIGEMHDYIRGVKGNFKALEETLDRLLALRNENPRLHVDLGTVISNYNIEHLDQIEDWVHERGVESYRHEVAEQRAEFHNLGDPITPGPEIYEMLTERFKQKIFENVRGKGALTQTTEAVRLVYYDVAVRILKERRQVTPCYGGISNIHLNFDGELWPCCVLGGDQSMGNVREQDYDIRELLRSDRARCVRRYIADGNCACPLANQWLNNVLLTPRHMAKVLYTLLVLFRRTSGDVATPREHERVIPGDVHARVVGTTKRKALVMRKLGTVPEEEDVDVPRVE